MPRASLSVRIGGTADQPPFDLAEDQDLRLWNFPATYAPLRWWDEDDLRSLPLATMAEVAFDRLLQYGSVPVRLYTDEPIAELVSLDPLTAAQADDPFYWYGGGFFRPADNGYDGRQVVPLGERLDLRREALEFNGQTEQRIRYWSGATGLSLRSVSEFRDETGAIIAAPAIDADGRVRLAQPGFGAVLAEYVTRYLLYRVYFDVPNPTFLITLNEDGTIAHLPAAPQPVPMTLFARAGRRMATLGVQRRYGAPNLAPGNDGGQQNMDLTERKRQEVTDTIVDENNPANSVDISRMYDVELQATNGQIVRLRFNKSPGA